MDHGVPLDPGCGRCSRGLRRSERLLEAWISRSADVRLAAPWRAVRRCGGRGRLGRYAPCRHPARRQGGPDAGTRCVVRLAVLRLRGSVDAHPAAVATRRRVRAPGGICGCDLRDSGASNLATSAADLLPLMASSLLLAGYGLLALRAGRRARSLGCADASSVTPHDVGLHWRVMVRVGWAGGGRGCLVHQAPDPEADSSYRRSHSPGPAVVSLHHLVLAGAVVPPARLAGGAAGTRRRHWSRWARLPALRCTVLAVER